MSKALGLDYWVSCLSQTEMLALSNVISEIDSVCASKESSATRLAELILQDASLTSKILQVANSVYYKPDVRKTITTVSRAVVLLGFSGVKSILILTLLIEHVLKNGGKKRMLSCLARALHRASQARFLAAHVLDADDELLEEVFVYGLVYDLAEMAFWGLNKNVVVMMEQRLAEDPTNPAALQKELLGASFKQITCGLVKRWKLGSEFENVFSPRTSASVKVQAVILAEDICQAVELGWQGSKFEEVLPTVAKFIGINRDDTRVLLKDRAQWAFDLANSVGAEDVARLIPAASNAGYREVVHSVELQGDPALQLEILRDFNAMNPHCLDINAMFHLLLEAINRGIGLARVGIFIVNKTQSEVTLKYALGMNIESWQKGLKLSIDSDEIFTDCFSQGEVQWLRPRESLLPSVNTIDGSKVIFDTSNALIAAIRAGNKPLALIIADGGKFGKVIDNTQYENFCYFSEQVSRLLTAAVE